jgi:hypothetical protein
MISANKNQTRFYYKEEMKIKQGYDKKNVFKIGVEQIKGNWKIYLYLCLLGT